MGEYVKWLNIVYDKLFEMDKSVNNKVSTLFDDAYKKYDETIKKLSGINKSQDNYDLRDITFQKNDYLLYYDYMDGQTKYDYTISLPYYLEEKYLYTSQTETNYEVLNLKYSFEEGIIFDDENNGLNELGE